MRRFMILSACVVGVLATSAANALATPEIARCVSQPVTGKYWTAGCTVKLAGQHFFELKKGAEGHLNFTATSGYGVFEGASGVGVVCSASTATGVYKEVNGKINSVEHVVWTFTSCAIAPPIDAQCNGPGQAEGTIVYHELKGKLGYLAGEKTKAPTIGLQLEPSDKSAFAEFDCGGGLLTGKLESVKGHNCIISELTPPNTMSTTISQVFETEGRSAKQKWTHFERTPTKTCQLEWSLNGEPRELVGQFLNQTTVTSEIPLMAHGI